MLMIQLKLVYFSELHKKVLTGLVNPMNSHENIGYRDISIKELANLIKEIVGYSGKYNMIQRNQMEHLRNIRFFTNGTTWVGEYEINLEDGLKETYNDFKKFKIIDYKLNKQMSEKNSKVALNTGVTGQDGSYLVEF